MAIPDSVAAPGRRRSASARRGGKYSGEPISVNLKDVDLRDFFRLIHEISGLNVVVDPGVKGTLTIVLDDVPWDQALDIVLHNNDLDKQLDGNVLRIATKETLQKGSGRKPRPGQGPGGSRRRGDHDARAELRQGHGHGRHAQEVSVVARRHPRGRPLQYADHPRHSEHAAGDRQPDPPARPQVATGGNRSARGGCEPLLLARNRHAVRLCRRGERRATATLSAAAGRGYQPDHPHPAASATHRGSGERSAAPRWLACR